MYAFLKNLYILIKYLLYPTFPKLKKLMFLVPVQFSFWILLDESNNLTKKLFPLININSKG